MRKPARPIPVLTAEQLTRFLTKVDIRGPDECWPWLGSGSPHDYGNVCINLKIYRSHRVIYTLMRGEIPLHLVIDHLCNNKNCSNPAHMDVTTNEKNTRRALRFNLPHCVQGHEFTPENTHLQPASLRRPSGLRVCRTCKNATSRAWKQKRRLALCSDKQESKLAVSGG